MQFKLVIIARLTNRVCRLQHRSRDGASYYTLLPVVLTNHVLCSGDVCALRSSSVCALRSDGVCALCSGDVCALCCGGMHVRKLYADPSAQEVPSHGIMPTCSSSCRVTAKRPAPYMWRSVRNQTCSDCAECSPALVS